jgi:phosphohistidine phosphatase SixA
VDGKIEEPLYERNQFLTEKGENQARNTANDVREFLAGEGVSLNAVISSPYRPAVQTAQIVIRLVRPQTIFWEELLSQDSINPSCYVEIVRIVVQEI